MTNKERIVILSIFISVLGFSFISALKPVATSYINQPNNLIAAYAINNQRVDVKSVHFESSEKYESKMVNMLSEVLGLEKEDVVLALEGGSEPTAMLASLGILLSDLSEEYHFDIVGDTLVKFRA